MTGVTEDCWRLSQGAGQGVQHGGHFSSSAVNAGAAGRNVSMAEHQHSNLNVSATVPKKGNTQGALTQLPESSGVHIAHQTSR